jgi:hypothetical protein
MCGEQIAVDFEKEYANDETGALIAIDRRTVTHYTDDVSDSQIDKVCGFGTGVKLTWSGERRIERRFIAQPRCSAIKSEDPVVKGERIMRVNL